MPVAKKTNKQKSKSRRHPSTVTINAAPRARKTDRTGKATIVTVGGRASSITEASASTSSRKRKRGKDHGALPTWSKLESKANRKVKSVSRAPLLDAVPTVRFALILTFVAAAFTLYVGHVHATQEVLAKTQEVRRANHSLFLKYNRVKGEYDRLTGPGEIIRRARALGLIEDAAYGRTVVIED